MGWGRAPGTSYIGLSLIDLAEGELRGRGSQEPAIARTEKRPLGISLLLVGLIASEGGAQQQSKPNGPWVQDAQNLTLEGFRSYDQLITDLRLCGRPSRSREHTLFDEA